MGLTLKKVHNQDPALAIVHLRRRRIKFAPVRVRQRISFFTELVLKGSKGSRAAFLIGFSSYRRLNQVELKGGEAKAARDRGLKPESPCHDEQGNAGPLFIV
jgi:hypothetical protein